MARNKQSPPAGVTTGTKVSIIYLLATSIITFVMTVISMTLWIRSI